MLQFETGEHAGSVYAAFRKAVEGLVEQCHDESDDSSLIKVTKLGHTDTDIWGLVERGEYGATKSIVSKKTLGPTHQQTVDEAAMEPAYFRLHLPAGSLKGFLVMQRMGLHSAYGTFRAYLSRSFKELHEDWRVHFAREVTAELFKAVTTGSIHGYKIVTYSPSGDLANWIKTRGLPKSETGRITVSIRASDEEKGFTKNPKAIEKIVSGKATVAELWPDDEFQSFKVTMNYMGRMREVDLTKQDDIFPYVIINDSVKVGNNGHPTFDSLHEACDAVLEDLKKRYEAQQAEDDEEA